MPETSKLQAAIKCKCPRCRKGAMFSGPMYSFRAQKMNEHCPHCGFKFEVEPGYFYAAMYVSYGLNVAQIIATAVLTYYLSGGSDRPWLYIGVIFSVVFILSPFNFRYSRVILLHWLSPRIKYNPDYSK